jgi:ribosomal protein S18 acetylase RimI-like enzyme
VLFFYTEQHRMNLNVLANIAWHSLTGIHTPFAIGQGTVRRYAPGFAPIIAFENCHAPDWKTLATLCTVGETLYCADWIGSAPTGWIVLDEAPLHQMIWQGLLPLPIQRQPTLLGAAHTHAMAELVSLTQPGPFGPRMTELGSCWGYLESDRLVAMAALRMGADGLREVSSVCTHPDFQGKGLARQLVSTLIRRIQMSGETPFLHVIDGNTLAYTMYERMGFRLHRTAVSRVLTRTT